MADSACYIELASNNDDFFTNSLVDDIMIRPQYATQKILIGTSNGLVPSLTVTSNNVGIGTTTPTYQLDVNGQSRFTHNNSSGLIVTGTNNYTSIQLSNQNPGGRSYLLGSAGGTAGSSASNFYIYDGTVGQFRVALSPSGNFGIGTSTPVYKLDVNGDINFTGSLLQNGTAWSSSTGSQWSNDAANVFLLGSNVGIQTSTPTEKLQVSSGKIYCDTQILNSTNDSVSIPAFSFKENSNTGIFHAGTDTLGFSTGGTERLRIDSTGNVGLGSTGPVHKLETNGSIMVAANNTYMSMNANNLNAPFGLIKKSGVSPSLAFTSNYLATNVANSMRFEMVSGTHLSNLATEVPIELMRLTNAGNLGISTTTPAAKLHVAGHTITSNLSLENTRLTIKGLSDSNHMIYNNGDNKDGEGVWDGMKMNTFTGLWIRGGLANGATPTTIIYGNSNGNVGVGTTSPSYKLDVQGTVGITGTIGGKKMQFSNDPSNRHIVLYETANNENQYYGFGINTSILRYQVSTTSANHVFYAANSGASSSELMRIQGNGNVGIGNASPSYKLDVNGVVRVADGILMNSNDNTYIGINAGNNAACLGLVKKNGSYAHFAFTSNNGSSTVANAMYFGMLSGSNLAAASACNLTTYMTLDNAGNLGINTTTPSAKLHVVGNSILDGGNAIVVQNGQNGGTGRGIYMWNLADSSWGIYMGPSGANRSLAGGTAVAGYGFSDYSVRMRIGAVSTYGFIVENSSDTLLMSIRATDGLTYFAGNATACNAYIGMFNADMSSAQFSHSSFSNNSSAYAIIQRNTGATLINCASGTDIRFREANSDKVIITGGSMGIGTTTPTEKLHVASGKMYSDTQLLGNSNDSVTAPSFSFKEDSNTGIFHAAADALGVTTGGAERLRVDANGNVGIGTSSPQLNMHLHSPSQTWFKITNDILQSTTWDGFRMGVWTDGSAQFYHTSNFPMIFTTAATERMRINGTDGNVGIGTGSPAYKLDVNGIIKGTNYILPHSVWITSADTNNRLYFAANARSYYRSSDGHEWRSSNDGALMVLTNGGNLGIGTTSPSYKLDVDGTINSSGNLTGPTVTSLSNLGLWTSNNMFNKAGGTITGTTLLYQGSPVTLSNTSLASSYPLVLQSYIGTNGITNGLAFMNSTATPSEAVPGALILLERMGGAGRGMLHFATKNGTTNTSSCDIRMSITPDGKVGIGTSNPSNTLSVNNNAGQGPTGVMTFENSTNTNKLGVFVNLTGGNYNGCVATGDTAIISGLGASDSGSLVFAIWGNSNAGIKIDKTGYVGVGTSSPSYKLDVNGTTRIKGTSTNGASNLLVLENQSAGRIQFVDEFGAQPCGMASYGTGNGLGIYAGSTIGFYTSNASSSNAPLRMNITQEGNVGIGISSPSYKLDVDGTVSAKAYVGSNYFQLTSNAGTVRIGSSGTGGMYLSLGQGQTMWNPDSNWPAYGIGNSVTGNVGIHGYYGITMGTQGNTTMTIGGGNVGIGTTSPAYKLDVNGTGNFTGVRTTGDIQLSNASRLTIYNEYGALQLRSGGGNTLFLNQDNIGGVSMVAGGGSVGVNTTTPTEKLHVASGKIYSDTQLLGNSNDSVTVPSFSFKEDSNTGIFHAATDALGITTGGAERVRVDANGNVGIGRSSPTCMLDVNNATGTSAIIRVGATDNSSGRLIFGNSSHGIGRGVNISTATDGNDVVVHTLGVPASVVLCTNSGEGLRVNASGNVGIGNASPSYKLDVNGVVRVADGILMNSNDNTYIGINAVSLAPSLGLVKKSGSSAHFAFTSNAGSSTTANAMYFGMLAGSNLAAVSACNLTTYMTLDNAGNLGIGTTTPSAKLYVNGNSILNGGNQIVVQNGQDGGTGRGIYMYTLADTNWALYMAQSGANKSIVGSTAVAGYGFSTWATRIRVANGSTQGFILENSSEALLMSVRGSDGLTYIAGNTTLNNASIGNSGHGAGYATFAHSNQFNTTSYGLLHDSSGTSYLNCATGQAIRFRENNGDIAIITGSKMGVLTSSPSYQLHVVGTIYATGDIIGFSDKRLKSNITIIDSALSKIHKLNGYTFNLQDDEKTHTGLIAQEVLEVLPEAVHQEKKADGTDGYYSLAYGNIAGLFVEAIKEIDNKYKSQITELQETVSILKHEIDLLKNKL